MAEYRDALESVKRRVLSIFAPPPALSLSEWAAEFARISPESGAEPGRWQNIPYQTEIMDAFTDPEVERVTVKKSARVGYTKILNNVIAYHAHLDPCNMLVVQPTLEDADGYSKDEIATMIRDTPALHGLFSEPKTRDGSNTLRKKSFPGGVLYLVGANSPRGFRRISAKVILFDETSGYPRSAGTEGDQFTLGVKRGQGFWDRKISEGSTPTTPDCHVSQSYEESDQRRYYVPCPHCQGMQYLRWSNISWPEGEPHKATYLCEHCGEFIEEKHKRWMVERGEWIAEKPFRGHAGFHIWAAYSYLPKASWGILATEFLEAQRDTEKLKSWTNTIAGEEWIEEHEQPPWELLQRRAEQYESPAAGAYILTLGVDVQQNRLECGVEGWAPGEENWLVEYFILYGDTDQPEVWAALQAAIGRTYQNDRGALLGISSTCIDSGYRTDFVYDFCRKTNRPRVYATKGIEGEGRPIIERGRKKKRGRDPIAITHFNVGVDGAKSVIYHRLQLTEPGDGYRHFPATLDQEYYEGLTAEKVITRKRRGFEHQVWEKTRARNEPLDIAVLNLAALKILNPTWQDITDPPPPPPPKAAPRAEGGFQRRTGGGFQRR